ncbi:hypothetical protein NLA06_03090 [Desulfomicrobium sp. ZS1]|uniref:hypothetical protein n=1 Tax=Desulfomicrobium sp. ZS1 TaxID=2952228 RepID=UPI0020B380A4|nr:hypothetical protein [Desulfomicrobium sp. ZS1]UTF50895.1 hypothetical protein NLA06_03090 [Desulfomicrobium sp. ZS1]
MAIKNFENGRVEIGGRVVRKSNPEERKTLGMRPEYAATLEYVLSQTGFDPKSNANMQNLVKRDDEYLRNALMDFEKSLFAAYQDAMTPAISSVKNIMADTRFTNEARRNEALKAIEPARVKWIAAASKYLLNLQNGLRDIEILIGLALVPETEGMTPEVVEARARECREAVLGMEPGACAKLLLELGAKGALEPLHSLKSDPLKREAASAEVLAGAREAAIMAQGGEWLLFDWKQHKRILEAAGARLATMEAGTNYGLQALGLEGFDGNAAQWVQVVNNALAKSEAVLV